MLARLFRRKIAFEGIFVNKELVKIGEDQGAINIRGGSYGDEQDCIALGITYLAGVVGDNILLLGLNTLKEKKLQIIADERILNWSMGGGDVPSFNGLAQFYAMLHQRTSNELKDFSLSFLIDFLTDTDIWAIVEKLSSELQSREDLKISEDELDCFFTQNNFDELLDKKCVQIQDL